MDRQPATVNKVTDYFRQVGVSVSRFRDLMWDYPDSLFFGRLSLTVRIRRLYMLARPHSHFISSIVIVITVLAFVGNGGYRLSQAASPHELIEGVVMGVDEKGQLQNISRVSPLIPSAIQLEKDISELVYEPLIRYQQDGSIQLVLADHIIRIQEGADYEFELRENVKWHDYDQSGEMLDLGDVIRSLEIVSQLDENNANSYVQAIKQMAWERTGDRSIRICTVRDRAEVAALANKCSGATGEKPILANFLELISIKIVPEHLAGDLNARTINTPEPYLNRFPVGTGPYKFAGAETGQIDLVLNNEYYGKVPKISQIKFKLFKGEEQATVALQNGEIHSLATTSTQYTREVAGYPQITVNKSPVLQNQYWALYFNLRKNPDGAALGPAFFQDVAVRQAISSAINREKILENLDSVGIEAKGPISTLSEYYNASSGEFTFNVEKANQLLDAAGWNVRDADGIRIKDGNRLVFKLSYVDNFDRNKIAKSIQEDLLVVGVGVELDKHNLGELTTTIVTPKLFDTLLYGMNTFVDPDRYELFHSTQSGKLNLSSYVGSDLTRKVEGKDVIDIPRVDKLLEQGRSFDPLDAKDKRVEAYNRIQELIAADSPAVFLYQPQFIYYANKRLQNVDLSQVSSLEQRFRNIAGWALAD